MADVNQGEQEAADLSKMRGQKAAEIKDPKRKQEFIAAQGKAEAKNKGKLSVIDKKHLTEEALMPQYKRGVKRVPKTGPAVLHKGERVIPASKNKYNKKKGKGKRKGRASQAVAGKKGGMAKLMQCPAGAKRGLVPKRAKQKQYGKR